MAVVASVLPAVSLPAVLPSEVSTDGASASAQASNRDPIDIANSANRPACIDQCVVTEWKREGWRR